MTAHTRKHLDLPLLSLPMMAVLLAQFLSALGDNMLLLAAIALVKARGEVDWIPLLQEFFVVPFILLAPFAGPLADSFSKGRVMWIANNLKLGGAALMFAGLNPLLAYGLVGVGAVSYSPAKYGILSQFFGLDRLVKANGMLEGSTIVAILLGVVVGGRLADHSVNLAFWSVIGVYAAAAGINLLIPKLPAEHPLDHFNPAILLLDFATAVKTLWANNDARFSLLGTSMFWGAGATLRLALFAWVPAALLIMDNQTPANLMGAVSVGIVAGAFLAGWAVSLAKVNRALIGGLLLGPLVLALSFTTSLPLAVVFLAGIGAAGGFFVVPQNALLQERGHERVGAGHALAVQNLWENVFMLLFVGGYYLAVKAGVGILGLVAGFGLLILIGIGTLAAWRLRGSGADAEATLVPTPPSAVNQVLHVLWVLFKVLVLLAGLVLLLGGGLCAAIVWPGNGGGGGYISQDLLWPALGVAGVGLFAMVAVIWSFARKKNRTPGNGGPQA